MPSPRLSKADREKLLDKLRAGHDLEAARASLELSEGQIEAGGDKLRVEIGTAFRVGTARLRGQVMEKALNDDNAAVLLKLLEQRTALQEGEHGGITKVERVIFNGQCHHCGRLQTISDDPGPKELARKLAFVIANGSQSTETPTGGNSEAPKQDDNPVQGGI